jgi:glycosyltransferase EpsD
MNENTSKKVLFVASTFKHLRAFHIPYIKMLQDVGVLVDSAANEIQFADEVPSRNIEIPISRSPFSIKNISAILQLRKKIKVEKYDLIHCHTAMGSVVARIAASSLRTRTKVIYTAHGFHFFRGGPIKNWLLYFPMELVLSFVTDVLITINREDFHIAKKYFKSRQNFLLDGVGLNTNKFDSVTLSKDEIRLKNGFRTDQTLILYIAEFIPRKNHRFVIELVKKKVITNCVFLFAGRGHLLDKIAKEISDNQLEDQIKILGFRSDIAEIIKMCDFGISLSKQEGLPMNVLEFIYSSKTVLVSNIRGNNDIIEHYKNGLLFELDDSASFCQQLALLIEDKRMLKDLSYQAKNSSSKYAQQIALEQTLTIYKNVLNS